MNARALLTHDGVNGSIEESTGLHCNRKIADEKKEPKRGAVMETMQHSLVCPLPSAALRGVSHMHTHVQTSMHMYMHGCKSSESAVAKEGWRQTWRSRLNDATTAPCPIQDGSCTTSLEETANWMHCAKRLIVHTCDRPPQTRRTVSPHSHNFDRVNEANTSSAPEPSIREHMNRSNVVCSYANSHHTV